jgi:hypothetical protein
LFYFTRFPDLNPREHRSERKLSLGDLPIQTGNNILPNLPPSSLSVESPSKEELACVYFTHWVFDFSKIVDSLNNY